MGKLRHQHQKHKRQIFKTATQLTEEQIQQAAILAREAEKDKKERGLYGKYGLRRLDGSTNKGGKHEKCDFFVLDITHDVHAVPAIFSYARSAEADGYTELAKDLYGKIQPYIKKLNDAADKEAMLEDIVDSGQVATMSDAELANAVSSLIWSLLPQGSHEELVLTEYMARAAALFESAKKKVTRAKKASDPLTDKIKKVVKNAAKNTDSKT